MIIRPGSKSTQAALAAVLLLAQALPALAERDPLTGAPKRPPAKNEIHTPSPISDRFAVEGIFYPFYARTGLRLDPRGMPGMGTQLSAEHDLGFAAHQYKGRFEATFRLAQRSKLRVDFEDVDRSATTILAKNITFGDQSFLANERADTELAYRILTLSYTYSFYRTDNLEIGVGLAAHLIEAQANGSAFGALNGNSTNQNVRESVASGFPTFPLEVTWLIDRQLAAVARVQYFRLSVGSFSGSLMDLHGDLQYRLAPNFTLGAGYTLERIGVEVSSSFAGELSIDTRGPEAFFRVSF